MRYQDASFSEMENVGLIDGAVRGSVSIAMLLAVLLTPAMSASTLIVLTLIAMYTGLTAFLGWDPFYALTKKSRARASLSAAVIAHPNRTQHGGDVAHKKAA